MLHTLGLLGLLGLLDLLAPLFLFVDMSTTHAHSRRHDGLRLSVQLELPMESFSPSPPLLLMSVHSKRRGVRAGDAAQEAGLRHEVPRDQQLAAASAAAAAAAAAADAPVVATAAGEVF